MFTNTLTPEVANIRHLLERTPVDVEVLCDMVDQDAAFAALCREYRHIEMTWISFGSGTNRSRKSCYSELRHLDALRTQLRTALSTQARLGCAPFRTTSGAC